MESLFDTKTIIPSIGIAIIRIIWSRDCLIFVMRIHILVRWHFYVETILCLAVWIYYKMCEILKHLSYKIGWLQFCFISEFSWHLSSIHGCWAALQILTWSGNFKHISCVSMTWQDLTIKHIETVISISKYWGLQAIDLEIVSEVYM